MPFPRFEKLSVEKNATFFGSVEVQYKHFNVINSIFKHGIKKNSVYTRV